MEIQLDGITYTAFHSEGSFVIYDSAVMLGHVEKPTGSEYWVVVDIEGNALSSKHENCFTSDKDIVLFALSDLAYY